MSNSVAISRTLSYWLRHRPQAAGLDLDAQGWADVDAVLAAFARGGRTRSGPPLGPVDWERLIAVVDTNDKKRFELSSDGSRIRARQGHSVSVDLDLVATPPPDLLFHGTVDRFWPSIREQGLRPMRRHHVHLSPDVATALAVGGRRGVPVILQVDAAGLARSGSRFFVTGNGVWLTDAVPPAFLARIETAAG